MKGRFEEGPDRKEMTKEAKFGGGEGSGSDECGRRVLQLQGRRSGSDRPEVRARERCPIGGRLVRSCLDREHI